MWLLILGLVLFLGAHTFVSLRGPRAEAIAALGEGRYRGLYSLIAILGVALIWWGFARYRSAGLIPVWSPPLWTHYITIVLMWFAWVSFLLSNKSPSRIRGWIKHPQLLAVKIWSLAHLIANGDLGAIVLFGAFLIWAGYVRASLKRRGDAGAPKFDHFATGDAIGLIGGTIVWVVLMFAHPYLFGPTVVY